MIQHFDRNFKDFSKVPVSEPNKEEIVKAFDDITEKFKASKNGEEAVRLTKDYFALSDDVQTLFSLIYIRYTINTVDEKNKKLMKITNEISPYIDSATNRFESAFLASPYRKALEDAFGSLIFDQMELSKKTFSPEVVEDLVKENKLVTAYTDLMSSGLIEYKGEKLSLAQMGKYLSDKDRTVRKEANALYWGYYAENEDKIAEIYDRMVKLRTKIAKKLGFQNFLGLGYARMGRLDWTAEDAKVYREKILKYVVPVSEKIFEDQRKRLSYPDGMHYYDWAIFYQSGNPTPKGDTAVLVEKAREMYKEMNPLASRYFDFMADHHCLDLDAKPGKAGGGYMDYLPALHTSFIFSNSNGTSGDVDTLTHEFGHSLQGFLGGDIEVPSYRAPGYECCEMHSMSMEFLTYPWMDLFFREDTDKYRYQHLADAITFIPYGCIVDAFQTYCYENPDRTPQERKAYWRKLEKEYLPHLSYEGNPFLASGGYWMRQHHIFENPLYYLDYTIAQVVSLEFFTASLKDRKGTFEKYLAFDKLGGTYPFRKLLKKAGIPNPMDDDTLKDTIENVVAYLKQFDPEKLDR